MIREATADDLDTLVRFGCEFHREMYAGILACNPVQFKAIGQHLIENPDGTLLVLERAGEPMGMLGALCFTHPLSAEWIAGELFWWCQPSARGDGLKLLRAATQWAQGRGASRLQMVAPNDRVGELYRRLGFEKIETAWQLTLEPLSAEGVA